MIFMTKYMISNSERITMTVTYNIEKNRFKQVDLSKYSQISY